MHGIGIGHSGMMELRLAPCSCRAGAGAEGAPLADSRLRDQDCHDRSGVASLQGSPKNCPGRPSTHLPGHPVQVLAAAPG